MPISPLHATDLAFLQGGGITTGFILATDWTDSSLGHPGSWPDSLKQSLGLILANGSPAFLCWGSDHSFFCNDAFKSTVGAVEIPPIGTPCSFTWPSLKTDLELAFQGETIYVKQLNANLSPIRDAAGNISGILGICDYQYQSSNTKADFSSAHLLHQIVASAPFPIGVYVGREMRIVQANRAIIEVWGKGADVIGKTYREILPELEEQFIYSQLDTVFNTGNPFHARNQRVDITMYGKPTTFYFNYSFTPLYDQEGKVYGIMNTAADVTDLVTAKQQIEISEKNFKNMILQAPVAMCLFLGPLFKIASANAAMLNIWDKTEEEVIGRPVFEVLPDAKEPELEAAIAKVYRTGEPYYAVERPLKMQRHGSSEKVYQNFVCQPYRGGDGEVLGILAISIDVTVQVNARRELERLYKQVSLAKEAAELGTFDMDLATGKLEWDARCRELFGIKDDRPIDYDRDFDLKEVVEEAIELIRNSTESYEIILAEAPETCMVNGDSQRIEQVVINLLSNAIKYSPGANKVEVKMMQQAGKALVAVTDNGLGIAEDKINNLFSRFYRIEEATPNISGLGIGLYLSHEIISRHEGNIWVESELGKGSTFWFSLPL